MSDRRRKWLSVGLALLSGALFPIATTDIDIWPLAWVGMLPCLWAVAHAKTRRGAMMYGLLCGMAMQIGGFYWIVGLMERFAALPFVLACLVFLLLCAVQAVPLALFTWSLFSVRKHTPLPMTLLAPVLYVAFEFVIPNVFPFYLALSQAWQLHVIQIAELTGPLGVSALLFMTAGALYDVLFERPRRIRPAVIAAIICVLNLGYGHLRLSQVRARRAKAPKIKVGLVQPNVSFDMKGVENPRYRQDQLADLHALSREIEQAGAELIVWTESSYPYAFSRDAKRDFAANDWRQVQRGYTTPIVFGAVTYDPMGEQNGHTYPYNSALMLDRDGTISGRYDKIYLLMFGEYIPGLETFPWLRKFLPQQAGHFARGKEIVTFPFSTKDGRQWRLGPLICYEDILPAFGRELGAKHPHLFVNLTNDAWFGDTSEPWQHLALSVFRSVEHRTDLVRAVNTGVTAFIDATGKVQSKTYAVNPITKPTPADKLIDEVALMEAGHTVYAKIGDLFGYLCLFACLFLWQVWPRIKRRRKKGAAA